ncbi:MAG: ArsR family transcriptional regulator [Betaproteobacteria bacterium]|nr:MAG: ArsR family transcriptional regulator [Betaproteobacteria bacterium]
MLTLGELLTRQFPEREAILAPWLLTQSLTMIHAWRGIGKTHMALGIAYAVATGGKFLTWAAPCARRVLYIDGEMPAVAMRDRLKALVEADERDFDTSYLRIVTPDVQEGPMPDLAIREGQEAIEAIATERGIELIIVDNISTLCRNSGPENEAESWRWPQEWALRMRRAGRSVLFIHHSGKRGAQRGSSKREDTLDVVIKLKQPSDYVPEQDARFEIHFEKYRSRAGNDAKPIEAKLERDGNGRAFWTWRTVEDTMAHRVVALHDEGFKPGEIAAELEINKSTVSRHLKAARAAGLIGAGK